MNRKTSQYNFQAMRDRSAMNRVIRHYFDRLEYLEAETPLLSPAPIWETHIELFKTNRLCADGSLLNLYLLPSPEMWLKILLAGGAPSLYQIGKCFRNGEQLDRWHRIEFSMLEWYTVRGGSSDNMRVMREVINACIQELNLDSPKDIAGDFRVICMEEAFRSFAGFSLELELNSCGLNNLSFTSPDYPLASAEAFQRLSDRLRENSLPVGNPDEQGVDDLFHRLFIGLVEKQLPMDVPLVLNEWPSLVPTLSRQKPGTPWSDRWELYIRGVEVANCYGEETKLDIMRAFWKMEAEKKNTVDIPTERWPEQLSGNLPTCSGVAVGLDRLLALIRGDEGLQGLDLFPIHDIIPW